MARVTGEIHELDWTLLRQACGLALAYQKPLQLTGAGTWLASRPAWLPFFEDMVNFSDAAKLGSFDVSGGDIIYDPGAGDSYTLKINGGKFSSFVDTVLFAAPWCLTRDFRTVLQCSGVSHGPLSLPTSFLRESLFDCLESMGLYGAMHLKRFGFYGTGGGSAEARVYPGEAKEAGTPIEETPRITGARIFFARISPELAKRQKQRVMELLGLEDRQVAIIEIRDADGMGNSIQVSLAAGERQVLVSGDMPIYNHTGELVVDEGDFNRVIEEVCREAGDTMGTGQLPRNLSRELLPFAVLAGNDSLADELAAVYEKSGKEVLSLFRYLKGH